jgi:hypothetical protein
MIVGPSRRVRAAFRLSLAMAGALAVAAGPAPAQNTAYLEGTFTWDSTAGDPVAEAIDAALADMNFLHRRFARAHLQRENRPYRTITIEQEADTISIAMNDGLPIRAPATGDPVEWRRADGERMRVSITRERDGAIRQSLTAANHQRENLFRPSPDGQGLTLAVTMRADRMPHAIQYELVYRREQ